MPAHNGNANATGQISKNSLPNAVADTVDNRVAAIQTKVAELTDQMKSAQDYITTTQAQIDALNLELSNLQASVTP